VVEAGLLWQLERQAKQLTYHLTLCGAANPLGKIEGDNGEIPRNRLMLLISVAGQRENQQQSPSMASKRETKESLSQNQHC